MCVFVFCELVSKMKCCTFPKDNCLSVLNTYETWFAWPARYPCQYFFACAVHLIEWILVSSQISMSLSCNFLILSVDVALGLSDFPIFTLVIQARSSEAYNSCIFASSIRFWFCFVNYQTFVHHFIQLCTLLKAQQFCTYVHNFLPIMFRY